MSSSSHNQDKPEVRTSSVRVRRVVSSLADRGVVTLDADDFAQLEECMTQQKGPTERMLRAVELHRSLTSRR